MSESLTTYLPPSFDWRPRGGYRGSSMTYRGFRYDIARDSRAWLARVTASDGRVLRERRFIGKSRMQNARMWCEVQIIQRSWPRGLWARHTWKQATQRAQVAG